VNKLTQLICEEEGIQHAEEALLLAVLAVALVGAVGFLKGGISNTLNKASNCMTAAGANASC
jgi:Flp pilus assembly pilin Flp